MWIRRLKLAFPILISVASLALLLFLFLHSTPRAGLARALNTAVGGTITTDTVWTIGGSPYVLTGTLIVPAGVTLTIEPGVVVRGPDHTEIQVGGRLVAIGTPGAPILFTSDSDEIERWNGLVFKGGTGELDEVTVRYGGQDENSVGVHGNVAVHNVLGGQVSIRNSRIISEMYEPLFGQDVDYGLYVTNSHVLVQNTLFRANGDSGNDYGLYSIGASTVLTLTNNQFQDGPGYAVRLAAGQLSETRLENNVFSGVGRNRRVAVGPGDMAGSARLLTQVGLEGYVLEGRLTVPAAATLAISPGLEIKGMPRVGEILVQEGGNLQAVGSPADSIIFTLETDGGADTWNGLAFNGGTGELSHVTVQYGAERVNALGVHSNIAISNVVGGQVRILNSRILTESFNRISGGDEDYGLYVVNSRVLVSGTVFRANGNEPNDFSLYADGPTTVLTAIGNRFESGPGYAVRLAPDLLHNTVLAGNLFEDVGRNRRILIATGVGAGDAVLPAQTGLDAYVLEGRLTVSPGGSLSIQPGVKVAGKKDAGEILVQATGNLQAIGSPSEPIIFTSETDEVSTKWNGLAFDGGTGELSHVTVRYGGGQVNALGVHSNIAVSNVVAGQVRILDSHILSESFSSALGDDTDYGLYVDDSRVLVGDTIIRGNGNVVDRFDNGVFATGASTVLTVTNGVIQQNGVNGLKVEGGTVLVSCSSILANGQHGIHANRNPESLTVVGSAIDGNGGFGLNNTSPVTVNARYNWWGDAGGPSGSDVGGWGVVLTDPYLSKPGCVVDLAMTMSATPDPAYTGLPLTYTISVRNAGQSWVAGIVLTDALPSEVTYLSATGAECDHDGGENVVTCDLGGLDRGALREVGILVRPSGAAAGTIVNTTVVTSSDLDLETADNTVQLTTTVRAQADLGLSKVASSDPALAGEQLTYALVVTNYGGSVASGVRVTDWLPSEVTFVSASAGCVGTSTLSCDVGELMSDASAQLFIVVQVPEQGILTNTARVVGTVPDLRPMNNLASVTTGISATEDVYLPIVLKLP